MIVGILFLIARLTELFFLIPIIGMLSYFVDGYVKANQLTPTFILVPFIISVLAGVWAFMTLLFYASAKRNGYLLAFVDICIWGGLIASVYELRNIGSTDCNSRETSNQIYQGVGGFVNDWTKTCNMLKASFALCIMEIFFFFYTFLLALWVHHHHRKDDERSYRSERHQSRHSQRRRGTSGSRSRAGGDSYYDDRRRGTSRSQYERRSYVV